MGETRAQEDRKRRRAGIAAAIEAERQVIADRWVARLPELPLPRPLNAQEALDSLFDVLDVLERRLKEDPSVRESLPLLQGCELAQQHGEQRFNVGFSLDALVGEYLILRDELLKVVETQADVTLDDARVVTDFVVLVLAKAVEAFSQCRERASLEASAVQVRKSERQLNQLFAIMPFYAAMARGPEHVLELVTAPLKDLWGGRDPTGKPHAEAYPELGHEHFEAWDHVYKNGEPFVARGIEARVNRGDGRLHSQYFDLSLLPRRDGEGRVEGVAAFALDVTERRLHEADRERRSELEQQLVGIVSHDLRGPLSAVLFGVHTLVRRADLSDDAMRTLLRIQSSAERGVRMVRDLLDFTQARLGRGIQVQRRPSDFHELCAQVTEELRMSHPLREIVLLQEGDARGIWDADRMTQVVGNLISNALKYSPSETPVRVTSKGRADEVELTVHNLGVPIPAEAAERLFKPLERGPEHSGQGRSIGLGLYIVKHIVEAHGGEVSFVSTQAQGTTFAVLVPKT